MSRKRCNRKVYALIDCVSHAIAGAAITDEASLNKLRMIELAALDAFAIGKATASDYNIMAGMLNVSEQLALSGVGAEALPANLDAQQVMRDAYEQRTQALTAAQLQAMRHAYEYCDLQRSSISRAEFERVIKKTADKVRQHKGSQ